MRVYSRFRESSITSSEFLAISLLIPLRELDEDEAIGCVSVGRNACPKSDLGFTAQEVGRSDIPVGECSAIPSARQLRCRRFEEGPRFFCQASVQNGPE